MANAHGVERTLTDKINYMAEQDHQVTLVTYEQGNHPYVFELSPKVNCVDLDCRYFTLYKYSILKRLKEQWIMRRHFKHALLRLIEEQSPEVLVTTTYEGVYMNVVMSLRNKVRIVIESHTAFTHDIRNDSMINRIQKFFYLQTLKKCHLLITLTRGDASFWQQYLTHVTSVPNPVSFYPDSVDYGLREHGRIIAVGRYYPSKRYDRLIDAFFEYALYTKGLHQMDWSNGLKEKVGIKDMSDDEIIEFYKEVRKALDGKDYHIVYLKADDVRGNLDVIRKERSDDQGNELWFPLIMGFFNECPYSKERGLSGEEDLINHFIHRQELELRICEEVFEGKYTIFTSKKYNDEDIHGLHNSI